MIKRFCDKCGKELSITGGDRLEILIADNKQYSLGADELCDPCVEGVKRILADWWKKGGKRE